jgi:MFS family permease
MADSRTAWTPLAVLMVGTFVIVLDFFVVNVALPAIRSDLHASQSALEWVVARYGLTFASLLITAGRLADRYGRRRILTAGLLVFTAASVACGSAPDSTTLIAARLVQGAGAALISTSVLALMGVLYPGAARVRAIAIYGMVMGAASAGGQVLGGLLVEADLAGLGWRMTFLINLPIGLAGLVALRAVVPESRAPAARALDPIGLGLIAAALTALVLPLVDGRQAGWPVWSWLLLAVAPILRGAFAVQQRRRAAAGQAPLFAPEVFAN